MEIKKSKLNEMINEAVDRALNESNTWGIDWAKMAWLDAQGNKLSPKWAAIMLVRQLVGGDMDRVLAVLKSAVSTLELHKNKAQQAPSAEASADVDPFDFGAMNTGISSNKR